MSKTICTLLTAGYFAYTYSVYSFHFFDLFLVISLVVVLSATKQAKEKFKRVVISTYFALFMSFIVSDGLLLTEDQFLKLNDYAAFNEGASLIVKERNIEIGTLGYLQASRLLIEFSFRSFEMKKPSDLEIKIK